MYIYVYIYIKPLKYICMTVTKGKKSKLLLCASTCDSEYMLCVCCVFVLVD